MASSVLKIGNRQITTEELLPLLSQYGLLPQLVREVVIDEAIATIDITPEQVNAAVQRICQQHQLLNQAQLDSWLAQQGMTPEQLQTMATRQAKLQLFKQKTWGSQVPSYYLQRKGQLDRVVYSLLRVPAISVAQELYFRIQEGEATFAELARQYSEGPEAQTGGLVGPVELQSIHPTLTQLLTTMKPGQLWPPVRIGDWMVVVRLEELVPAQLDAAMEQRLLDELYTDWLQQQVQQSLHPVVTPTSV
ncbi:MAG: peptidylprolyl isomerase [Cyanobacteria bacterium]|nr:peptidylprolyl isomerase [Cyanobacteriota bacterium]MDW8201411.1 peptidylprolyl isomerase [Cyanobacteriota bacterium SKYGB_h_bin112]